MAGNGFGRFLADESVSQNNSSDISENLGILSPPGKPEAAKFWTSIIFWSELLTAGSFIILILSLIASGFKYVTRKTVKKN